MREILDTEQVRIIPAVLSPNLELLDELRNNVAKEIVFVKAVKRLAKAGRAVLEFEDVLGISEMVEMWERNSATEGIIDKDMMLTEIADGLTLKFEPGDPTLDVINRKQYANCNVEAIDIESGRALVYGWGEVDEDGFEPKSVWGAIIDPKRIVQTVDVHLLRVDREATDGNETQAEKDFQAKLIAALRTQSETVD